MFELTYAPGRYGKERPHDPATFEQLKRFVYDGLQSGKLKPVIDRVFPFSQIIDAHDRVESNQQSGKVVVSVP